MEVLHTARRAAAKVLGAGNVLRLLLSSSLLGSMGGLARKGPEL
jgi:hypothetical protein